VVLVHLLFLGGVWFVAVGWTDVAALIALSALRGLGITLGYHRLLTHRSFRTTRLVQFLLAVLGASTFENGPLWWVGHHRYHHIHSDKPCDIHSPRRGFWWSHWRWILDPQMNRPPEKHTRDLTLFPELVWLDRFAHLPGILLGGLCFWVGGWTGLVFVFAGSSVLILHGTWCVNSLSHTVGSRRFNTPDDSRNNFWVAFFAMGEGWHNNHHACPVSSRHGLTWYEVDATYVVIRGLKFLGLVWNVKTPLTASKTDTRARSAS
jgi:stearoyl-CoA desaturase (Delta-9 desaturase)